MKIMITGASGFLGQKLVSYLLEQSSVKVNGQYSELTALLLCDVNQQVLSQMSTTDSRISTITGAFNTAGALESLSGFSPDVIVHLAAVVSGSAEADFELGMDVNVRALTDLIDTAAQLENAPVFVFSSSIAVFGCQHNEAVHEDRPPQPVSSYGNQKLIGEILVRDGSRKGLLKGRSIRIPTVSVRPGTPNGAASSFASGIIREPLAGMPTTVPVSRTTQMHLASPGKALQYLVQSIGIEQSEVGADTTLVMPGISVSVHEMLEALERASPQAISWVTDQVDPDVEAIINTWPGAVETPRSRALGFTPDESIDRIIEQFVQRQD